jgi:adenylate kinase
LLDRIDAKLECCLALVVDEEAVVKRLLGRAEIEGRSDDNEETIRNRMQVYRESTEPLVAYYRERGLLAEVDGMGTIDEVAARIEEALG